MPLLTLNVAARNDNYLGDFKWRFNTMLNFLGKSVATIGRQADIEVQVIDWNSEVPLHRALTLCPEAAAITRFIVVPPEIAIPAQRDSKFPIPIAVNVGIRHAGGEFIAGTDSDVLYTPATLLSLFAVLEGRIPEIPLKTSLMVSVRRHIPYDMVLRQPKLRDLQEYIARNHSLLPHEPAYVGTGVPGAHIMMHRDRWNECRGYDERMIYWGWLDVDLVLRMSQEYSFVYLDNFGVHPVHLEHYRRRGDDEEIKRLHKLNHPDDMPRFLVNDENWGLALHRLAYYRAENVGEADTDPPSPWVLTAAEAKHAMEDPALIKMVQGILGQMPFPVHPVECNALRLLAWYASTRHPRLYVETGMRQPHAACIVAKCSPGTEVHAIVSWQGLTDENLFGNREGATAAFFTSSALARMGGQWAFTQFITGDPATAIQRLSRSYPGHFGVDLALVRSAPDGPQHAMQLAERLNPGGAMVVTSSDMSDFEAMWKPLCQRFPQRAFVQITGHSAGMMLDATVK
jgi:glycosyltransferase involved in cell wall biosynthesis